MRFSKQAFRLEIAGRQRAAEAEFKRHTGRDLDPGDGWAQCRESIEATVAYGQWVVLDELLIAMLDEGRRAR